MIKIIISFTKVVIVLLVALVFTSCRFSMTGVTGDGNVTTKTRDISGEFTSVSADRGIEVVIEQSESKSVTVEADENLHQHITTVVENGVLKISSDDNIFDSEQRKVTVKMPVISGIETAGGASLTSSNTLKSNGMTVAASSGSEIEILVEADKLTCESSSGSSITIGGKALSFETSSSSGSEINAKSLLANDVLAQSNSGSSVEVHPIVSLDAEASSGSSVTYHSIPKKIKVEENSGGSVSQQ